MHQGRVAVVTGAASGIGRATALLFAERGVRLVIADVDHDGGTQTEKLVRDRGGEAVFVPTDVSVEAEVAAMVRTALDTYGRLDHAVNNAGIDGETAPLADQTSANWQRVIDIDLTGVFYGIKHEVPAMIEGGGGSIVNISSTAGVRGYPGLSPYVAAKHGVNGLTKTAAVEYGPHGIRVNSICPGAIGTPMLLEYLDANPDMRAVLVEGNPLRRMSDAREIAETAYWLCSDASSYISGHVLVADGGKTVTGA
ncbi:MAG TPA: glucose 1-dehydrogenase [Pseudonocardia sp.]|jgi:NAD(P)-dependent dehydrogenase (short-subunit alcohol dehydrogenase family)